MTDRKINETSPCYEELESIIDALSKTSPVTAKRFKDYCDSRAKSPYQLLRKIAEQLINAQDERICLP